MRMTRDMLEELATELKRKNKILLVCLIVSIALLFGMTIFAFSEFHITYENSTTYTTEQSADTQGDNSHIEQTIETSDDNGSSYIIAGAVIVGLLILTVGGVLIYGKSTSKNHNKKAGESCYNKNIPVQQEKKEVTDNGKTDED